MQQMLLIFQIVISAILIVFIVLQQRGSQLGVSFGGGGESYRSKRGMEKFLYYGTIVFAILFASSSILALVV